MLTAHYNSRGHTGQISGHLISTTVWPPSFIFLSPPSTLHQSVAKTISCTRLLAPPRPKPPSLPPNPHYTHTNTRTQATNLQNNNPPASLHRSFLLRLPHSLSCNSILMGFIGWAIHLSAAAQFNYISEPAGLSPDNLQRSPPGCERHMCLRPARATPHSRT